MIQFAMLLNGNVVQQINLVDDYVCTNSENVIDEQLGIAYLQSLYGPETKWVMGSHDGSFRGKPAMSGDIYDSETDTFVAGPDSTPYYPSAPDYEVI